MHELLERIRACRICEDQLDPRPVIRVAPGARILVVGQAPGTKVHASGVPWDDASGDHLLEWLDVSREQFEDPTRFGIVPMGFCYPGRGKSGDAPPPPICHATWHHLVREQLDGPVLTLLVGQYAVRGYLGKTRKKTLAETVRAWREYGDLMPLPHPSWRSRIWLRKNPWFADEVLPALRRRVREALVSSSSGV